MNQMPSPVPAVEKAAASGSAVTALVLSLLGAGGWLTLITLLLPYGVGNNGTEKAVGNVLAFGINFLLLIAGSSISGTLSFSGLLIGAFSLGIGNDRLGYAALGLGAAGLIGGRNARDLAIPANIWIGRPQLIGSPAARDPAAALRAQAAAGT